MTRPTQARSQQATSEQSLLKVTLLKPHTHAGVAYDAGTDIEVDAPTQDFLISVVVIADPATAQTATGAAE